MTVSAKRTKRLHGGFVKILSRPKKMKSKVKELGYGKTVLSLMLMKKNITFEAVLIAKCHNVPQNLINEVHNV